MGEILSHILAGLLGAVGGFYATRTMAGVSGRRIALIAAVAAAVVAAVVFFDQNASAGLVWLAIAVAALALASLIP